MGLVERKILDQVEIKDNGVIQVKEFNQVLRDGQVISSIPYRSLYCPGEDVSQAHDKVKQAAAAFWNDEVVAAYKESQKT